MKGRNTVATYAAYGSLFGVCFPVFATALDLHVAQLSMTWENIVQVQATQPLHWIIDTAPLFLGLVASFVGLRQARIEALNTHLEDRVDQRTRELKLQIEQRQQIEEELRQAVIESQAAAAMKSEFMATMSHEIRTPLNGVIGMTGLLMETPLDAEQQDYANTIRTSGEVLLGVINDILDFSKLEAGQVKLEVIPFNLRSAIEDTIDLVAHQAVERHVELGFLVHHDTPAQLLGDPGRIRQVLLNLLSNAIKFTEQGEVLLTITAKARSDHQVELLMEVEDTGIGIPQDRLEGLFDAFSQADASTTRKYGGTGLGLSIAKRLVTAMGGEIGAESAVGQGSKFWFRLPLAFEKVTEQLPLPRADSIAGKRVLVVDDNETNRRIITHHLDYWGCSYEQAGSGLEALERLLQPAEDKSFDLVLMDFQMPGLDGAMLAAEIKKQPSLAELPLILITSIAMQGEQRELADKGFSGYLTKPIKASHLFECIALVLDRSGQPQTARTLVNEYSLPNTSRSRARLLIAEDNLVNQKVAVRILQKAGFRCDVAANGKEAVEAMTTAPYDLVLMDCQMPEMDGYEATRSIRALEDERACTVPIIAMTASALEEDRRACRDAGMDDFVSKPVNADVLLAAIDQHLGALEAAS